MSRRWARGYNFHLGGGTFALSLVTLVVPETFADWPGFRGHGDSISTATHLPLHWSDTTNLTWRIPLPGLGQSSPIIWGDTVYVTCVSPAKKEDLVVLAIDASSGQERWRYSRRSSLPEEVSDTRSNAAPTPIADRDGVFAFFESGDCLSLDHAGRLRWHRSLADELGGLASNHGLGGSPTLAGDILAIPLDQEKPSCLVALDRATGNTRWKSPRPRRTAWSSPLAVGQAQDAQILVSGGGTVTSYRADSGDMAWELGGFVKNLVPSPTFRSSLLVIGAGSKGSNVAYEWSGSTNAPVERWRADELTCGFASPLVHQGKVYFVATAGILSCHDAASGKPLFEERLGQSLWASPVGAGDRVYLFGEGGTTTVLAAENRFLPLATNAVAFDSKVVGVAPAQGAIFIRSYRELVQVGRFNPTATP